MSDILLETFRAIPVLIIFIVLLVHNKDESVRKLKGWPLIITGFGLILFGVIIDITDNFPDLNQFIIIGDTKYQAFLEKVIGYLLGFLLLAVGFSMWLPLVKQIKSSENALRDNEQLLNSIFRSAPIGIGLVVNRVFLWTNERLSEITGYSKAELENQSSRIVYPSDEEFEWVGNKKYKLIREHGTGSVETKWQRKDGGVIDVLLSSTPLDLDDLSKGITFTVLDITQRKRFMLALEESEERYREIFNDTSDGIFIHDADTGKIVDVNKAVTEIYGFTAEEAQEKSIADFTIGIPPYTEEDANARIAKAAESGPQVFEWHAKKKNGQAF